MNIEKSLLTTMDTIIENSKNIQKYTTKGNDTLLVTSVNLFKDKMLLETEQLIKGNKELTNFLLTSYKDICALEKREDAPQIILLSAKEIDELKEKIEIAIGQSTIILSLYEDRITILSSQKPSVESLFC